jgi:hypothetical protein
MELLTPNRLRALVGGLKDGLAREACRRRAFLMELDTLYCDVSVRHWEEFAGKTARREKSPGRRRSLSREAGRVAG